MHTGGGPLTPVSDNERLPMERYSPWALRDHVERHPLVRRKSTTAIYIPQPSPEDIEILLKTYWSAIHPVSLHYIFFKKDSPGTNKCIYPALAHSVQACF